MDVYRTAAKVTEKRFSKYRVIVSRSYNPNCFVEDQDIILGYYSYWIAAWVAAFWYMMFNPYSEALLQKRTAGSGPG